MKKPLTLLTLAVFVLFLGSLLVRVGQAGSISLGTFNSGGVPTNHFLQGSDVRIIADSSDMPITIKVTDPDGVVVHNETHYDYAYDQILSNLAEKIGKYTVEAASPWDEEQENYARTYYDVFSVVGGKAVPINKLAKKPESLSPYIELTILLAVAVSTVVYVEKSKNQ